MKPIKLQRVRGTNNSDYRPIVSIAHSNTLRVNKYAANFLNITKTIQFDFSVDKEDLTLFYLSINTDGLFKMNVHKNDGRQKIIATSSDIRNIVWNQLEIPYGGTVRFIVGEAIEWEDETYYKLSLIPASYDKIFTEKKILKRNSIDYQAGKIENYCTSDSYLKDKTITADSDVFDIKLSFSKSLGFKNVTAAMSALKGEFKVKYEVYKLSLPSKSKESA